MKEDIIKEDIKCIVKELKARGLGPNNRELTDKETEEALEAIAVFALGFTQEFTPERLLDITFAVDEIMQGLHPEWTRPKEND